MKQIQGRFLLQSNKDFPADCEMLDYMQTNAHVVSIIGNLAGDKAILLGCALTGGGTQRSEGYVFLRTKEGLPELVQGKFPPEQLSLKQVTPLT